VDNAQPRFGQLTVQGFRRLRGVRLVLKPLSVMIGANGTGKTSVLDVLSRLASSAEGRLNSSLATLSGLSNGLTYDHADEVGLGIAMGFHTTNRCSTHSGLGPRDSPVSFGRSPLSQSEKATDDRFFTWIHAMVS
jgi:predicted ATPase